MRVLLVLALLGTSVLLMSCAGTDPDSPARSLVQETAAGFQYYARCKKLHGDKDWEWRSPLTSDRREAQLLAREHNDENPGHNAKWYRD